MPRLAPLCLAALFVLATGCGGDEGDSRHFGGDDASDDAATTGDIGFSETASKDQVALGDVPTDAVEDPGPVGETIPCDNACPALTARECVGAAGFRTCVSGGQCLVWSAPEACASDEVCQAGACIFDGPDCSGLPTGCDAVGAKRCSVDATAVETCSGAYECPKWEVLEVCQPGKPCVNGACGGGDVGACAALEACVDTTCAEAVASGSNIKLGQCTFANCRTEYEGCMGPFGTGACKDLLKCAQACQDEQCQKDCAATASYDANVQFVDVGVCLEDNCPGALQDPMANISCIIGTCGTQLNACCAGNVMSCM